jgi:hypothetical protein
VNAYFYIDIHSTGARSVTVSKVICTLRGGEPAIAHDLQAYYCGYGHTQHARLVGEIALKPDEHWGEFTSFYRFSSQQDDREARQIEALIPKYLYMIQSGALSPNSPTISVQVQRAINLFNRYFRLTPGDYDLFVGIVSDKGKLLDYDAFRFSIDASDIQSLRDLVNGYRQGDFGDWSSVLWFQLADGDSELAKSDLERRVRAK